MKVCIQVIGESVNSLVKEVSEEQYTFLYQLAQELDEIAIQEGKVWTPTLSIEML